MANLMFMRHPEHKPAKDTEGRDLFKPATTTREAFDTVWKDKGWQETDQAGKFLTDAKPAAEQDDGAPATGEPGSAATTDPTGDAQVQTPAVPLEKGRNR